MSANVQIVLDELRGMANPDNVAGMARFGINPAGTLGISVNDLRKLAKRLGTDHALAEELYASGIHEAKILACFVADAKQVSAAQMERWALAFDSWDVTDQACTSLFDRSELAWVKAVEWSEREAEFVKRGGFALMAGLAWHHKTAPDERFEPFFGIILRESADERNYVKKAVNWALRNIGKRSRGLNQRAIETAEAMRQTGTKAGRWNASDALRELTSEKIQGRLKA